MQGSSRPGTSPLDDPLLAVTLTTSFSLTPRRREIRTSVGDTPSLGGALERQLDARRVRRGVAPTHEDRAGSDVPGLPLHGEGGPHLVS